VNCPKASLLIFAFKMLGSADGNIMLMGDVVRKSLRKWMTPT